MSLFKKLLDIYDSNVSVACKFVNAIKEWDSMILEKSYVFILLCTIGPT